MNHSFAVIVANSTVLSSSFCLPACAGEWDSFGYDYSRTSGKLGVSGDVTNVRYYHKNTEVDWDMSDQDSDEADIQFDVLAYHAEPDPNDDDEYIISPAKGKAHTRGTVHLYARWRPTYAGEALPKQVTVKIGATADAWRSTWPVNSTFTPSLNNGFGAPTIETRFPGSTMPVWRSTGYYLKTFDASKAERLPAGYPGGWTHVLRLKLPVMSAEATVGANGEGFRGALTLRGGAEVDRRRLWISSDIEESYKKVTNTSELPPQLDQNGKPIPNTVDTSKIRTNKTPYPGAGPWAVKCESSEKVDAVDGITVLRNMEVHSVADYSDGYFGLPSGWYTGSTFTARHHYFSDPKAEWKMEGGTLGGDAIYELSSERMEIHLKGGFLPPDTENRPARFNGIALGGAEDTTGMVRKTKISVKVKDASDGMIAEDAYTVNWHTPVEDWYADPAKPTIEIAPESATIIATAPGQTAYYPNEGAKVGYDFKKIATIGSAVTGTAESAGKLFVKTTAQGRAINMLGLLSKVSGLAAAFTDSVPNIPFTSVSSEKTTYDAYKRAVLDTKNDVTYPDGTRKFEPKEKAQDAIDNFKPNSEQDKIWTREIGALTLGGKVDFHVYQKYWVGDEYEHNGYAGLTKAETTNRSGPFFRIVWTLETGAPSNSNPPTPTSSSTP